VKEGMHKLQCGECGGSTVDIYINAQQEVSAECVKCKSVTNIVARPSIIELKLENNSKGILCIF
jgi:hypothetical protein